MTEKRQIRFGFTQETIGTLLDLFQTKVIKLCKLIITHLSCECEYIYVF